ncbi:MAG: NAD(P)-dependent oxidoreductase, partial [Salinirussus sp.]
MSAPLSIVVLREDIGPAPAAEYAECLADRFPDHDVHFARTPAMERSLIETADVVAGVHLDKSLLNLAQELELFACSWTGTDHLPLSACREAGVAVTNASGVHAPGLAAQAIGKILVFTRNLQTAFYQQQDRRWEHFRAGELDGSTVTIVGLGSIGSGIAGRLSGFDL